MTTEEHRLIVEMFKQQMRVISTLIAVLQSRGILEKGDLDAYDALQSADEPQVNALEGEVEAIYQRFAKVLGVTTGLRSAI